jgi:Protein of unknown function with HXXEE motif
MSVTTGRLGKPWWLLALPVSYLAHLGEEWWGGEGFASWTQRTVGAPVSETRFIIVNSVAAPLFVLGTVLAITKGTWAWFAVTFATVLLVNGTLHVLGSLGTASYSPGVITSAVLFLPLGLTVLRRGQTQSTAAAFWVAVALGLAIHGVVAIVVFWR